MRVVRVWEPSIADSAGIEEAQLEVDSICNHSRAVTATNAIDRYSGVPNGVVDLCLGNCWESEDLQQLQLQNL